jgi:hypothetical protein
MISSTGNNIEVEDLEPNEIELLLEAAASQGGRSTIINDTARRMSKKMT